MKGILAAIDHSAISPRVAELGADLASRYQAELVLLTALPGLVEPIDPRLATFARMEKSHAPVSEVIIATEREALAELATSASARGAPDVRIHVVVGDPAEEILHAAAGGSTDLIVIGTRGRGRLAGLLLGSVAQKVVSLARCPVLVVR